MLKKSRISEVAKSKIQDKKAIRQWRVPSYSRPGTCHYVTMRGSNTFRCTCPHHTFRSAICAHIMQVRELIEL